MKNVYESQLAVESHMIQHLLHGAGIEAQVLGDYLQGGTGELPAAGLVRVVVADHQEAEARTVIAEWERTQPAGDSRPMRKGWRHSNVAMAFIVGAIGGAYVMWWALRTP